MKAGLNMLKPNIGLTKREFALIAILLATVMGYLLFTYLLQPVYNDYTAGKDSLEQSKAILSNLKASYDRKSEMENQLKEIDGKLQELTVQIPPYMSQEEVILLVDSLSQKNMLTVQMISFDNAGAVPSVAAPAAQTGPVAPATQTTPVPAAAPTLIDQDISLSFSGSYSQIYSFLSDIEKNLRKVAVKGISLQKNQADKLTGQLKLSFVSYWDALGQQPYIMEVAPIAGRDNLFVPYLGYSESATKGTSVVKAQVQPDFYMFVNGYLDNAAKVILSQYPDAASQVSEDVNGPIKASMDLEGDNKAFTYAITVGADSKSSQAAVQVKDGKIRMEIQIQAKKSDKDLVSVTLDVNNKTSLPLEIAIKGENKDKPRFALGKTIGSVTLK